MMQIEALRELKAVAMPGGPDRRNLARNAAGRIGAVGKAAPVWQLLHHTFIIGACSSSYARSGRLDQERGTNA